MFKSIKIQRWRQFSDVFIDFDTQITVVTGVNGSGKTTLLHILSKHFGWNLRWIASQTRSKKKMKSKFWTDVWEMLEEDFKEKSNTIKIGTIEYENGVPCELHVPIKDITEQYDLNYLNQQPGLIIGDVHAERALPMQSLHERPLVPRSVRQGT